MKDIDIKSRPKRSTAAHLKEAPDGRGKAKADLGLEWWLCVVDTLEMNGKLRGMSKEEAAGFLKAEFEKWNADESNHDKLLETMFLEELEIDWNLGAATKEERLFGLTALLFIKARAAEYEKWMEYELQQLML
jgi:hypothetical protein